MKKRITSLFALLLCLFLVSCGTEVPSDVSKTDNESSIISSVSDTDAFGDVSLPSEESLNGFSAETVLAFPEENSLPDISVYTSLEESLNAEFAERKIYDDYRIIIAPAMEGYEPPPTYIPCGTSHSDENNPGIQSGDVIQQDEKFIYVLSFNALTVYSAENGEMKECSKTLLPQQLISIEMLTFGNRIIIVCSNEDPAEDYKISNLSKSDRGAMTCVFVVDISKNGLTKQTDFYVQSGLYLCGRKIDNEFLLITRKYTQLEKKYGDGILSLEEITEDLPVAGKNFNDLVPPENIEISKDTSQTTFTVMSRLDIQKGEMYPYARMTSETNFYITDESVYTFEMQFFHLKNDTKLYSKIDRYSISDTIVHSANATVEGQFWGIRSISEYNGYLRVPACEDYGAAIFILDKDLNTVGELYGIGGSDKDSFLDGTRTHKDIIGFELGSKLWLVDVSDPETPKETGSIDNKGWANRSIKLDDNRLLSAYYTRSEDYFGISINLYSITDDYTITELDRLSMPNDSLLIDYLFGPGIYTDSTSNIYATESLITFPYQLSYYNENNKKVQKYMVAFISCDDSLEISKEHEMTFETVFGLKTSYFKTVSVGDFVYIINLRQGTKTTDITSVSVKAFSVSELEMVNEYHFN